MKKILFALMILSVVFILGCKPAAPAAPAEPAADTGAEPAVVVEEGAPEEGPAGTVEEGTGVTPGPTETVAAPPEGTEIEDVCYDLITAEEFQAICAYDGTITLTHKISEEDCWTAIQDSNNRKLNAGFTAVEWKNEAEAGKEFDRGVGMRKTQGAVEAQKVGDRNYEYSEIGRHNIVWQRGRLLTRLASATPEKDQKGCPKDKLLEVAKLIDSRMPR
jgi:hypothetical protein